MGDDDFDLDDDLGLDSGDGGDDGDFAGSLDNVMDDDDAGLGGGSGGETELDSFFEDLSSIDDMDGGESEPAKPAPAAAPAAAPVAPAAAPAAPAASGEKKGRMKWMILALLLGLGGGGYWFLSQPPPEQVQPEELTLETVPTPAEEPVPMPVMVESAAPVPPPRRPVQPAPLPPPPPPPEPVVVAPTPRFLIQVGSCSFEKCKRDFMAKLRARGIPVYYRSTGEKYDFIELVTKQVFALREAQAWVKKVNNNNERAGVAVLVPQSNGYRVTLGTFTALDTAKDLKVYLEELFLQEGLKLNLEHVRKNFETIKIYAGPYASRSKALRALKKFRRSREFTGAFLVRY